MYNFQFIFYFSLAFFITKNTASFPFFIVSHPLTHLILFLVCFFFSVKTSSSGPLPGIQDIPIRCANQRKRGCGGVQIRNFSPNIQVDGVLLFACVLCMDCDFCLFVCLFVCLSVCCFFTSLYICNIFVIYNIYTWFLFVSRTFFVIYSVPVISSCISLKSYVFSQFVNVCLAVTCLLCYNICCCLIK